MGFLRRQGQRKAAGQLLHQCGLSLWAVAESGHPGFVPLFPPQRLLLIFINVFRRLNSCLKTRALRPAACLCRTRFLIASLPQPQYPHFLPR